MSFNDYNSISKKWNKTLHKIEIGRRMSGRSMYTFRNKCLHSCLNIQVHILSALTKLKSERIYWFSRINLLASSIYLGNFLRWNKRNYVYTPVYKILRMSVSISKASSSPLLHTRAVFHKYRICFTLSNLFAYLFITETLIWLLAIYIH